MSFTIIRSKTLLITLITLSLLITGGITGCGNDETVNLPSITTTDSDGSTSIDDTVLTDTLTELPLETVSTAEADGMVYMREEEKLAHDVYVVMFSLTGLAIFDNISKSEQTHTDAVLTLLDRYTITDPVGSNAAGVFTDSTLQDLYLALIAQGSTGSILDALYVGAAIEEIDIIDIQLQLDTVVDNQDINLVYENLIKGSRNHLRAFVDNISKQGVTYTPQYLTQTVYDEIINSPIETN